MPTRRDFIERTAATAALGAFGLPLPALELARAMEPSSLEEWDTTWASKLTGKHRAVFDIPEIESGYGVWRANAWVGQYQQVLKAPASELTPVIVLRHNAIVLAMRQAFWDKYGLGKMKRVTHPLTGQPTEANPVLLDETSGLPSPYDQSGLHKQIARGVTVLACNLALQDCVELIKAKSRTGEEAARKEAMANLVPGVILQPSGVFAAILAQENGCSYLRAS